MAGKWWQFWDPNKRGGKGKAAKPTGGNAGSGRVGNYTNGQQRQEDRRAEGPARDGRKGELVERRRADFSGD